MNEEWTDPRGLGRSRGQSAFDATMNPLFMGGLGLLASGGQMSGLLGGMSAGNQFQNSLMQQEELQQERQREETMQMQDRKTREALGAQTGLDPNQFSAKQMQDVVLKKRQAEQEQMRKMSDPMYDLQRQQAKANLAKTQMDIDKSRAESQFAATGELPSKDKINLQQTYQDDFTKTKEVIGTTKSLYEDIASIDPDDATKAEDLTIARNFVKILDPGAAVTESEINLSATAPDTAKYWANKFGKIMSGELLDSSERTEIMNEIQKLYVNRANEYNKTYDAIQGESDHYGLRPQSIFQGAERIDTGNLSPFVTTKQKRARLAELKAKQAGPPAPPTDYPAPLGRRGW